MRSFYRIAAVAGVVLGLAITARGQEQANKATSKEAITKALEDAMTPGEGQKRLDPLIGTFDVKVRTWLDPSKPPIESAATAVDTWVLGGRYVQQMLAGYVGGEPWSGISYAGYDNVTKKYVSTYIDTGSTGMEWYTGTLDPDGTHGRMTATIADEVTGKPKALELRLTIAANGDRVTELWEEQPTGKMAKVIEFQFTRKKS